MKINLLTKNDLPFGSASRLDKRCHTVSEQILVFADVHDTEDDSLKQAKESNNLPCQNIQLPFSIQRTDRRGKTKILNLG